MTSETVQIDREFFDGEWPDQVVFVRDDGKAVAYEVMGDE